MIKLSSLCALALLWSSCSSSSAGDHPNKNDSFEVQQWLTKGDQSQLLAPQPVGYNFGSNTEDITTIAIDKGTKYQTMDGFGYTLTGGSADLIHKMSAEAQDQLIKELFSREEGVGVNYIRISVGASDLSASVFTYNDLDAGQTDEQLQKFSIDKEKESLIPVLKKILAYNPKIKILGSPWTAPVWMKDNQSFIGGSLLPKYYQAYANYLVKYIRAMDTEGIRIDALTIQNEPLHPGNNPSMYMLASDQANFIKNALGPTFEKENIKTKIIIYDHNADKPEYPIEILNDPQANKYIDGSAFHLYAGDISALSKVHEAHPTKHLYFTEQWVGGPSNFAEDLKWHATTLLIGAPRNWAKNVLEWNVAADSQYNPHTDQGGCKNCLGAVTIDQDVVARNVAYYVIAHASKFVPDGSVRIASTSQNPVPNVAYLTPDNTVVLIAVNNSAEEQKFKVEVAGKSFVTRLAAGDLATYTWK